MNVLLLEGYLITVIFVIVHGLSKIYPQILFIYARRTTRELRCRCVFTVLYYVLPCCASSGLRAVGDQSHAVGHRNQHSLSSMQEPQTGIYSIALRLSNKAQKMSLFWSRVLLCGVCTSSWVLSQYSDFHPFSDIQII